MSRSHERNGGPRRRAARRSPFLAGEDGYTLAELIVAAFMATFVLSVVFAAVRIQGRGAAMQAGVADAQLTARGAGELLMEDLRMAGYGMLGVSSTTNLPPLAVTTASGTTTITLRGNYSNVSTTLAVAAPAGASTVTVAPPANGSAFVVGNRVLIDSGLASEVKTIQSVGSSGGNVTVGLDTALANAYPIGPQVTQLETVTYTFNGTMLRRNNQVVADTASSFQLQYVAQNGTVTATPQADLRSVLLTLVAKQPTKLPDNPAATASVSTEMNMRNLAFRFTLN